MKNITRRQFVSKAAGGLAAAAAVGPLGAARAFAQAGSHIQYYDYIVVGSGAGGGTVASRLASRRKLDGTPYRVLMLEAGNWGDRERRSFPIFPDDLPVGHAWASEDPNLAWSFYVKHYKDKSDPTKNSACPYEDTDNTLNDRNLEGRRYRSGILYPRGSTIGGSTAINAMITLYPDGRDWDAIGRYNKDERTWNATTMYDKYFTRFDAAMAWSKGGPPLTPITEAVREWSKPWFKNESGLGNALIVLAEGDTVTMRVLVATLHAMFMGHPHLKTEFTHFMREYSLNSAKDVLTKLHGGREAEFLARFRQGLIGFLKRLQDRLNPNTRAYLREMSDGILDIPKATLGGHRFGTRNFIRETHAAHKANFDIKDQAFVTRIVFDDGVTARAGRANRWTAIGVEYVRGENFFEAAHESIPRESRSNPETARRHQARLLPGGEVILAGGTFNTPQLLMLSGIGPKAQVEKWGIHHKVNLPGVGTNLQDRYEITVITKLDKPLGILEKCEMGRQADESLCMKSWNEEPGKAVYSSNGVLAAQAFTSSKRKSDGLSPDMIIFGLSGNFPGYTTNYSRTVTGSGPNGEKRDDGRYLTWAVLKGHTDNSAGVVELTSKDWWKAPYVNFHSFEEGWSNTPNPYSGEHKNHAWADDVQALLEGTKQIRDNIRDPIRLGNPVRSTRQAKGWEETLPAPRADGKPHDDDSLKDFIRKRAWGHHACGTCPMGPKEDPTAVVDKNFKVHGVNDLRIVDASVFRKIPGLFIVVPTYLVAEKAAAAISGEEGPEGTNQWRSS